MTKTRGLTLGKFAPLHKGHQLVIETALSEMDEVVAIIYDCPDTTTLPLILRANWIRDLYSTVQVVEAWKGPLEIGQTRSNESTKTTLVLLGLAIKGFFSWSRQLRSAQ